MRYSTLHSEHMSLHKQETYRKPVLKDHPIGHKNVVSKHGVFGDRFSYVEM